jgi:hypothetical protein
MGELRLVAFGLIVVVVDLRFNGVDIATDIAGWALAGVGLTTLSRLHEGFQVAAVATVVGAVAWAGDPWLGIDRGLAAVAESVAQTVIVFACCTALIALVPEKRSSADQIRWWDLGLGVVVLAAVTLLEGREAPLVTPLLILAIVPVFVVYIAFLVLLFRCAPLAPRAPAASR